MVARLNSLGLRNNWRIYGVILIFILIVAGSSALLGVGKAGIPAGRDEAIAPDVPDLGKLPLAFESNVGQTDASVRYIAHAQGSMLFFTPSEVVLSLRSTECGASASGCDPQQAGVSARPAAMTEQADVVRLGFPGASTTPSIEGGTLLSGKVNYFIGSDPSRWHTNVATHDSVTYNDLYPGVSLTYQGRAGQLKGTYTVAPHADPTRIHWRYTGASKVALDDQGNLQITVSSATPGKAPIVERAPVAWQEVGGKRLSVSARYVLEQDGTISFALGSYDPAYPLTLDPTLMYSTYLGGSNVDSALGVADNLVVGHTTSTDFPTQGAIQPTNHGAEDVFVSKLSPSGSSLEFSTYLGGSGYDEGDAVAVNGNYWPNGGAIYIAGGTTSTNFPTVNPYQPNNAGSWDAFVAMLRYDGAQLLYSTYYGGNGDDIANGIGFDRLPGQCCYGSDPYIAGSTTSTNFPTISPYQPALHGPQDAFVAKLSAANLNPSYSTYLGGSGIDEARGISVSLNHEAYVTGRTTSNDFPTLNAYQPGYGGGASDAFVTKFNAFGSALTYSTYLGGNADDWGNSIAVDSSGNAVLTGASQSNNYPTQNAYQPAKAGGQDAIVTKLNATGSNLVYSTYLGGSVDDEGRGIGVDRVGQAYLVGWTYSTNFPVVSAIQPNSGGGSDAFISKFNAGGSALVYSTYLGGSADELGNAVAVETREPGIAYVAGSTYSSDFPVATPFQPTNHGQEDAFVASVNDRCGIYANYDVTSSTGASIVPGTTDIGNHCDNCKTTIALPFSFNLYDTTLTSIDAWDNGFLDAGTQSTWPFDNTCLPNYSWTLGYTIVPHWDNLRTDCANCGIFTSTSGSAPNRIFNIEWRAQRVADNGPVNFEARLYEGQPSRFDFIYGVVTGNGDSATIGVQKHEGYLMTQYSCNQPSLSTGLQLTFTEPPCGATTPTAAPPTATPTNSSTPIPSPTETSVPPTATSTTIPPSTTTPSPTSVPTSTPCPIQFADVTDTNPFYTYVRCLACRGILGGYNDNTFRSGNNITRGQIAKIVSNAANFNDTMPSTQQTYTDVPYTSTFWLWIERLTLHNVMSGYNCGGPGEACDPEQRPYFRWQANATRGQLSKIVANADNINDAIPSTQQTFEDVPSSNTFWLWIERLAQRGVMGGYACGQPPAGQCVPPGNRAYFLPFNNVTRGQASKIVANTFFPNCQTPAR